MTIVFVILVLISVFYLIFPFFFEVTSEVESVVAKNRDVEEIMYERVAELKHDELSGKITSEDFLLLKREILKESSSE